MSATRHRELTELERQVALLAAWGGSNREVAEALGIDAKAVQPHLTRVYRKLSIHSRAELPPLVGLTSRACEAPLHTSGRRGPETEALP